MAGFPAWVPCDVRRYLVHTEQGRSIRALARTCGCHASTVLRQVQRNETRRDDPLIDAALGRLARAVRRKNARESGVEKQMTAQARRNDTQFPDDKKLQTEARRILRRLAEPEACLAIAPDMEKAVVVRELPDGRTIRTGVLDREVAEAFVVKDWIAGKAQGRVSRYRISTAGRAALKRLLAEDCAMRQGFHEAPAAFGDQHREYSERPVRNGDAKCNKRIRYNVMESPLAALARRRGKDNKPFLSPDLVAAGERLREDFELGQMGPRIAQNWDRFLTGGARGAFRPENGGQGPEGARDRVAAALRNLGPGLGDVVLRCCCFLEGMEQAEKRMGWSARSGKIVLKIALQRLKRHYDEQGDAAGMIG